MSFKKDIKALLKELSNKGWRIEQPKRNAHYKAYPPFKCSEFVLISATPNCSHAVKNARGDIKRLERKHLGPERKIK